MKNKFLLKFVTYAVFFTALTAYAVDFKTNLDVMVHGKQSSSADKDIVFDLNLGSSNPRIRANKGTGNLEFSNDGATFTEIGSGSGGGGNFDPAQLQQVLDTAEASGTLSKTPGQILDSFTSSTNGTLTNMSLSGGALGLTGANLSGSLERTKELNITAQQVAGILRGRLQQIAPKDTAMTPSSTATSVTVKFSDDVTDMFTVSKKVIIVKKTTSDGSIFFKAVRDTALSKVALLTVSSVSYSGGETSLVLANPDALDLDLDVSGGSYSTDLRVIPFDVKLYAKGTGSYPASDAALTDLISLNNIGIPAESLASAISGLTGSLVKIDARRSASGQYVVAMLTERTAGNSFVYKMYSTNYGTSWISFGSVDTSIANGSDNAKNELVGLFNYHTNMSMFVADNGKAVYLEQYLNGSSQIAVRGSYTDLSVGSPSLSSLPSTGVDAANNVGTSGIVFSNAAQEMTGTVWGDPTDGSGIFMVGVNVSTGAAYVRQYNAGGSAFLNVSGTIFTPTFHINSPYWVAVSGSSGSHRYFVLGTEGSNQRPYYSYFDEGSATIVGQGFAGAAVNSFMVGAKSLGTKLYGVYARPGTNDYSYVSVTTSGTPSISSEKVLTNFYSSQDQNNGWSATSATFLNFWKNYDNAVVINPSDSEHAYFTLLPYDRDSARRARLWEIRSDSGFAGSVISQLSQNAGSNHGLNDISSRQYLAQTVTLSSTRIRTVTLSMNQYGLIASGSAVSCEIQNTTAGVPNGSVVATSVNTYDPRLISLTASTAGQAVNCNFDTQTLTGVYAIVVKSTYSTSASNFIAVHDNSTNPYAGGELYSYDGSTWSAISGYDMVFDINSEWVYSPQNEAIAQSRIASVSVFDMEPSIELIDSSNIAYVVRNWSYFTSGTKLPYTGYLNRRIIGIGSGSSASSIGVRTYPGYASGAHDPNVVLNVQSGNAANARKNVTTGVVDTTREQEDRSQVAATGIYSTLPTYSTQGSMQNTRAANTMSITYGEVHNYISGGLVNPLFAIEVEYITPASFASDNFLVTNANGGTATGGFYWKVDTSGRLNVVAAANSGFNATTSSTTLSPSTHYILKWVGDGNAHRFYINGVEVAYSAQQTGGYTMNSPNTGDGVTFGSYNNNTSLASGYFGYYRMVAGATSFATSGYVDQTPFVSLVDLGSKVLVKKVIGENGTTNGTNFYEPTVLAGSAASMVDSYDMDLVYNNAVDAPQQGSTFMLKLEYGRTSTRNISVFPGLNFRALAP